MAEQGKSKYADRLKGMKSGFANAQKQAKVMDGDEVVPVGTYEGKVTARVRESNNGNLMVNFSFFILDGEWSGIPVYDNLIIEHSNPNVASRGQRDLVRRLAVMGFDFDPEHPEDLEDLLEELSNDAPIIQFKTRHSQSKDGDRTFVNCDVLGMVEQGARKAPARTAKKKTAKKKATSRSRK